MQPIEGQNAKVPNVVRFGIYEVDLRARELRKGGVRLRVQDQPFKVLAALLEQPGEVITREELRRRLWPEDSFGDFDHALNVAVKKLRDALSDSAENPRFIETLARRGYRFIAPVRMNGNGNGTPSVAAPALSPAVPPATAVPLDRSAAASARRRRFVLPLVVVAALTIMGIANTVMNLNRRARIAPSVRNMTVTRVAPLTSAMGWEIGPRFSPDGKQIAFAWSGDRGEAMAVYVKLLDAGTPVRITPVAEDVRYGLPVWSPDGKFLACLRMQRPPRPPDARPASDDDRRTLLKPPPDLAVYTLPALGGPETRITPVRDLASLAWSPDGRWLLISDSPGDTDPHALYLVSLQTHEKKQLTFPPRGFTGDQNGRFTPDGRFVAFSRTLHSGADDLFIVSVNGGEPRRITFDSLPITGLAFTRDGSEIVYGARWSGASAAVLWRVKVVRGHTPERIPFGDNVSEPDIAPVGERLAYVQHVDSSNIWSYALPGPAGAATPKPGILVGSTRLQVGAQFSPDGKRLVFASDRSGNWEIWAANAEGSSPHQLTSFGGPQTGTPRWSPDGKQIAFDSRPGGHSEIYLINADGGPVRRLTQTKFDSVIPSFSRDGRYVYFSSNRGGTWEIWRQPLDGNDLDAQQITHHGGFGAFESPDGNTLYYSKWEAAGLYARSLNPGHRSLQVAGPRASSTLERAAELRHESVTIERTAEIQHERDGRDERGVRQRRGGEQGQAPIKPIAPAVPRPPLQPNASSHPQVTQSATPTPGANAPPVAPSASDDEVLVIPDLLPRLWGYWAVTEHGIYYVRPAKRKSKEPGHEKEDELYPALALYSFATHKVKDVLAFEKGPRAGPGLAIAPDGRSVAYMQMDRSGADIMVADNFR